MRRGRSPTPVSRETTGYPVVRRRHRIQRTVRIDETHAHDDVLRVLVLDTTALQAPTTRTESVSVYGCECPTSVPIRPAHESEERRLVQRHSRAHPTTARATVATRSLPARLLRSAFWLHGHRCRLCLNRVPERTFNGSAAVPPLFHVKPWASQQSLPRVLSPRF